MKEKKINHLLLVEDNEGDVILTLEALSSIMDTKGVYVASDGEHAINYLSKLPPYEKAKTPNIILLDINLPKVDGKEVLSFIKNHPELKKIPVIMLTTSSSPLDIDESYSQNANCYLTKPVDLDSFLALAKSIQTLWSSVVKLP